MFGLWWIGFVVLVVVVVVVVVVVLLLLLLLLLRAWLCLGAGDWCGTSASLCAPLREPISKFWTHNALAKFWTSPCQHIVSMDVSRLRKVLSFEPSLSTILFTSTDALHVHRSPIVTRGPVSAVNAVNWRRPGQEAHRYIHDQLLAA